VGDLFEQAIYVKATKMMTRKKGVKYISRLSASAITLVLLTFIVIFAEVLMTGLIWLYFYEKPSPQKTAEGSEWKRHRADKMFLPDGTLHLVYWLDTQSHDDFEQTEITDVNGNILWQGIYKERPFEYLTWASLPGFFHEQQMRFIFSLTPDLSGVLEVPVRAGQDVNEVWRYDFEAQVFAGYEIEDGLIGYLGAGGFVNSKAQMQPLGDFNGLAAWTDENPSSVLMLWWTKRQIYQIDFRSREVETIFESTQSDINFIDWHNWRPQNPKDQSDSGIRYRPLIDCRTKDGKHNLIMREPNQILTVDLPEQRRNNADFTATSEAIFVQYREKNYNPPESPELVKKYNLEYNSKPQPHSVQLYKVVDEGKLALVNRFDWTKPVPDLNSMRPRGLDQWEIYQKWMSKTSPPMFDLLWYLFGDALDKLRSEGTGMMREYADMIMQFRPGRIKFMEYEQNRGNWSPGNYLLSAVMMVFALWHGWARRTSWVKLILWLIIVGAFNLAGLLTYLGLNHTPVIKCPICGKKRGLESLACIRCGSNLPIPQRRPTDLISAS
jgi:hypothetical protein